MEGAIRQQKAAATRTEIARCERRRDHPPLILAFPAEEINFSLQLSSEVRALKRNEMITPDRYRCQDLKMALPPEHPAKFISLPARGGAVVEAVTAESGIPEAKDYASRWRTVRFGKSGRG